MIAPLRSNKPFCPVACSRQPTVSMQDHALSANAGSSGWLPHPACCRASAANRQNDASEQRRNLLQTFPSSPGAVAIPVLHQVDPRHGLERIQAVPAVDLGIAPLIQHQPGTPRSHLTHLIYEPFPRGRLRLPAYTAMEKHICVIGLAKALG